MQQVAYERNEAMARAHILLVVVMAAQAAQYGSVGDDSSAPFFMRFTDVIQLDDDASDEQHYIGGETRRVLAVPATDGPSVLPVDDDGAITLDMTADLPALADLSEGLILQLQYYDGPVSLFSSKRRQFVYVSQAEIERVQQLTLRPPGMPTPQARVYARQALPHALRLKAEAVYVPEGAQMDFAVALQKEWRISRDAQAQFRIRAVTQHGNEILFDEIVRRHDPIEPPQWREYSLDLAKYTGDEVQFVFETEALCDDPLAFPLWGAPLLYGPENDLPHPRPSIILVALDTLRADHLGCYGYSRNTSPNIDRFAEESILFEQAIAAAPWTTPSFASLFTGKHPAKHKAGVFSHGYILDERFTTLAEHASRHGLLTAAFTEGVAVRGPMGFARGFDIYSDGETPESHRSGTAEETFRKAAAWLEDYGHLPFFLFVHTYEPHAPYDVPAPWIDKFTDPEYEGPVQGCPEGAVTVEDKQHIRDRYDGCIAYTDHWVGWFMEQIDRLNLSENTVVVILSDHGEEFWEHGDFGHVSQIYDEVLHVPLIMRIPGDSYTPQRVERQIALTDVFATLLELLDISVSGNFDSQSLLPLVRADAGSDYSRDYVVSELCHADFSKMDGSGRPLEFMLRSIRWPNLKYIIGDKNWVFEHAGESDRAPVLEEELYDLRNDPGEMDDLADSKRDEIRNARKTLSEFLRSQGVHDDRSPPSDEMIDTLSESDIQALQALGYL